MIEQKNHFVQLYRDDGDLARSVVPFLKEGADRGDCMIVVPTPNHRELLTRKLCESKVDVEHLRKAGKLIFFDPASTLSSLLVDGMPDPVRFETLITGRIREWRELAGDAGIRAYGEMVDLLWKGGKPEAALRLEEMWNRLLETEQISSLFCSYSMDLLENHGEPLRRMVCAHSHLLPLPESDALGRALDRAMGEVFGPAKAAALRPLIRANHFPRVRVSETEAAVLWLRHNLPRHADEVFSRVRAYRREANH